MSLVKAVTQALIKQRLRIGHAGCLRVGLQSSTLSRRRQMIRSRLLRFFVTLAGAILIASCSDSVATNPTAPAPADVAASHNSGSDNHGSDSHGSVVGTAT